MPLKCVSPDLPEAILSSPMQLIIFFPPLLHIALVLSYNDSSSNNNNSHLLSTYYMPGTSRALFLILRTGSERLRRLPKAIHKEGAEPGFPVALSGTPASLSTTVPYIWPLWRQTTANFAASEGMAQLLWTLCAWLPCSNVGRHYYLLRLDVG